MNMYCCSFTKEKVPRLCKHIGKFITNNVIMCKQHKKLLLKTKLNKIQQQYQQVCPICIESIIYKNSSTTLECSHIYHTECIQKWFMNVQTCPTCRNECTTTGVSILIEDFLKNSLNLLIKLKDNKDKNNIPKYKAAEGIVRDFVIDIKTRQFNNTLPIDNIDILSEYITNIKNEYIAKIKQLS